MKETPMRKAVAATVLTAGVALAPAVDAVHAQDATTEDDDSDKTGLFGLIGLAGLAGSAGLKRHDHNNDRRRDTTGGSSVR